MDVRNLHGKTAMVTGAGSGIGRETAYALARRGADLFICDLDESGLKETQETIAAIGRDCFVQRVDVSISEEMRAFAEGVHAQVEAVDILVNNAGVGLGASFRDTRLEDWNWIVSINLMGVVHGCHFFTPKMIERSQGGHVVNVSSMAGYVSGEMLCAYSTTKYAVLGLSEALQQELKRGGIGVTAICPGIIDTPITRSSRLRGVVDSTEMRERMVDTYRKRGYGPERVARNILKAVQRNRTVAPVSPESWAMYYVKRAAPWLVQWMGRKGNERAMHELEQG